MYCWRSNSFSSRSSCSGVKIVRILFGFPCLKFQALFSSWWTTDRIASPSVIMKHNRSPKLAWNTRLSMIYLSCYFSFVSDNDFISWIELVFRSFKGNKDSSKRVVLVWKIEKLNYSSFTWWELYVIEGDTICKKAIKRDFVQEKLAKGIIRTCFNKNSSFHLVSFLFGCLQRNKMIQALTEK